MEAVPGLRQIAALADSNIIALRRLQALQDAARARGVEFSIHRVAKPEEIVPAIDAAKTMGAAALNVLATSLLFNNRRLIFERAAALPGWARAARRQGDRIATSLLRCCMSPEVALMRLHDRDA